MLDHRNRPVHVRLPLSALPLRSGWRRTPFWAIWLWLALTGICMLIAVIFIAQLIRNMAIDERWPSPPLIGVLSIVVMLALLAVGLRGIARGFQEHPDLMKAHLSRGLCPACTYPIAAIAPEPDGCRTCPECSAAWYLPEPPT